MKVWIQRHDFSYDDLPDPSESQALRLLEEFDHIMPASSNRSYYHYHFSVVKKRFGIFPAAVQETISVKDLTDRFRSTIIKCHYTGRHEKIIELLLTHGMKW